MKNHTPLIALTLLALAFAGCSKHSPDTTSTAQTNLVIQVGTNHYRVANVITRDTNGSPQTNSVFQVGTNHFRLANIITRGTNVTTQTHDTDTILPGRHMSEHQVIEVAMSQLPQSSGYRCDYKDGEWEILEVQQGVWGVSSRTTNADGKITVESTNATRVVLRVRDADGKVEPMKTP
jgi:hypothetical protein